MRGGDLILGEGLSPGVGVQLGWRVQPGLEIHPGAASLPGWGLNLSFYLKESLSVFHPLAPGVKQFLALRGCPSPGSPLNAVKGPGVRRPKERTPKRPRRPLVGKSRPLRKGRSPDSPSLLPSRPPQHSHPPGSPRPRKEETGRQKTPALPELPSENTL